MSRLHLPYNGTVTLVAVLSTVLIGLTSEYAEYQTEKLLPPDCASLLWSNSCWLQRLYTLTSGWVAVGEQWVGLGCLFANWS